MGPELLAVLFYQPLVKRGGEPCAERNQLPAFDPQRDPSPEFHRPTDLDAKRRRLGRNPRDFMENCGFFSAGKIMKQRQMGPDEIDLGRKMALAQILEESVSLLVELHRHYDRLRQDLIDANRVGDPAVFNFRITAEWTVIGLTDAGRFLIRRRVIRGKTFPFAVGF